MPAAAAKPPVWQVVLAVLVIWRFVGPGLAESANGDQATTSRNVEYSRAQAADGKELYRTKCSACHLDNLAGGVNESPPLKGRHFLSDWDHKPLRALYSRIITTMPSNDPGSLTEKQTLAVLAYLLEQNGFSSSSNATFETADSLISMEVSVPQ